MDLSLAPVSAPAFPAAGNDIDRKIRAAPGRATGSLSVGSALLAAGDWGIYLLVSPGKRMELGLLALEYTSQVARYDVECGMAGPGEARRFIHPPARDRRFDGDAWLRCPGTCSTRRSGSPSNGGSWPRGGYTDE